MTLRDSVDLTVGALALSEVETEVSATLVDLAQRYASEIDGAAAMSARASRIAADVAKETGTDSALYERVTALEAALSSRTALLALGKSLHAALTDLQATPKARGLKVNTTPAGGGSRLDELRKRREARA